jgi:hypothetical protein
MKNPLRTVTISYLPRETGTVITAFSDSSPQSADYASHKQRLEILAELEAALVTKGFVQAVIYYHPAGQDVQNVVLYVEALESRKR